MKRHILPLLLGCGLLVLSSLAYADGTKAEVSDVHSSLFPEVLTAPVTQAPVSGAATAAAATARRRDTASLSAQSERPLSAQTTLRPKTQKPSTEKSSAEQQYPGSYAGKFGLYGTLKDKVTEFFHAPSPAPKVDLSHLSAGSYMCKLGAEVSKFILMQ